MKTYSMRGKLVDVGRYLAVHEKQVAVGNGKMNARGDIVGRGGKVTTSREQVAKQYYAGNPRAVRSVSLKDLGPDQTTSASLLSPLEAVEQALAEQRAAPPKTPPKRPRRISE